MLWRNQSYTRLKPGGEGHPFHVISSALKFNLGSLPLLDVLMITDWLRRLLVNQARNINVCSEQFFFFLRKYIKFCKLFVNKINKQNYDYFVCQKSQHLHTSVLKFTSRNHEPPSLQTNRSIERKRQSNQLNDAWRKKNRFPEMRLTELGQALSITVTVVCGHFCAVSSPSL